MRPHVESLFNAAHITLRLLRTVGNAPVTIWREEFRVFQNGVHSSDGGDL